MIGRIEPTQSALRNSLERRRFLVPLNSCASKLEPGWLDLASHIRLDPPIRRRSAASSGDRAWIARTTASPTTKRRPEGTGEHLQSRRSIHRVPDRRERHAVFATDVPEHDGSVIEADAHIETRLPLPMALVVPRSSAWSIVSAQLRALAASLELAVGAPNTEKIPSPRY